MTRDTLLTLEVGREDAGIELTVDEIGTKEIDNPAGGKSTIVVLNCRTADGGHHYAIDKAFLPHRDEGPRKRTFFLNMDMEGRIQHGSDLAGYLRYRGAGSLGELLNKPLVAREDEHGFLAAVGHE